MNQVLLPAPKPPWEEHKPQGFIQSSLDPDERLLIITQEAKHFDNDNDNDNDIRFDYGLTHPEEHWTRAFERLDAVLQQNGREEKAEEFIAGQDLRCSSPGCSDRDSTSTLRPVLYLPDALQLARWEADGSNATSSIKSANRCPVQCPAHFLIDDFRFTIGEQEGRDASLLGGATLLQLQIERDILFSGQPWGQQIGYANHFFPCWTSDCRGSFPGLASCEDPLGMFPADARSAKERESKHGKERATRGRVTYRYVHARTEHQTW